MSDALLIALITGGFGIVGKLLDVFLARAKAAEDKPKRRTRRDVINPLKSGGILNPATAIFLVVGIVVGVAAVSVFNRPSTITPFPPTDSPTEASTVGAETPTHNPNALVKGGKAIIHTTGGDTLRIREQPDFNAKVTMKLDDGTVVTLLDGPRAVGTDHWWLVQTDDGRTGWAVETVEGVQTLQQFTP